MSQEELGRAIALTFQQVQKYERGTNRISASRLFTLSLILRVPASYFFEELNGSPTDTSYRLTSNRQSQPERRDPAFRRETLELVRAYYQIADQRTRQCIAELVIALGDDKRTDASD